MDGIINVYKEQGYTSHDVVAKLRGIVGQKKIGHTGTLDPDAVGVLPVCLGKATRVCDLITDKIKVYEAVVLLGITTDTLDTSGTVLSRSEVSTSSEQIHSVTEKFVGDIMQVPPMYSAIKVGGKKLYELARQGKEIERMAREITIFSLEVTNIDLENNRFTMLVECSKGTYIRTLCDDIGKKLGCGAAMEHLIRRQVGIFRLENSYKLNEIDEKKNNGTLDECVLPVDSVFKNLPSAIVDEKALKYLLNGNQIYKEQFFIQDEAVVGQKYRVYDQNGRFVAIYRFESEDKGYHVVKMF